MRLPVVVDTRIQTLLLVGPPAFGAILGGMLVGVVHKIAREPQDPASDLAVLASIAAVAAAALAVYLVGAARVRRGAPTDFPRLWRTVPWAAAAGFAVGLVAAGAHALVK